MTTHKGKSNSAVGDYALNGKSIQRAPHFHSRRVVRINLHSLLHITPVKYRVLPTFFHDIPGIALSALKEKNTR